MGGMDNLNQELLDLIGRRGRSSKSGTASSDSDSPLRFAPPSAEATARDSPRGFPAHDAAGIRSPERRPGDGASPRSEGSGRGDPAAPSRRSHHASDDDGPEDGEDLNARLPEDMVEGEADRAKLLAMTEWEREVELAERAEKRDREKERRRILHQQQRIQDDGEEDEDQRVPSRRSRDRKDRKDSAIRELMSARERKASVGRADDAEDDEAEEDEEEEEEEEDEEEAGDEEEEEDSEQEENLAGVISDSDSENQRRPRKGQEAFGGRRERPQAGMEDEDEAVDLKEMLSVQIVRSQLERWVNEPHFERTLPQCFVRMAEADASSGSIQRAYRIVEVVEVIMKEKSYKFGPRSNSTNKYLLLREGLREHTREMGMVSNQLATEEDFLRWQACCERDGRPPVSRRHVQQAREKISKATQFTYTAEDVRKMVEEKRAKGQVIMNRTAEKANLQRKRDFAAEQSDWEEVERLNKELQTLEARTPVDRSARKRGHGMASVNKRATMHNFRMAFTNKGQEDKDQAADGLDPFQRRLTRPNQYWKTGKGNSAKRKEVEPSKEEQLKEEKPVEKKVKRQDVDFREVVCGLDCLDFDLSCLNKASPSNTLVRRLLPRHWTFSDKQKELAEQASERRMLTLYDYRCRQGLIN
ncbi:unnamed protein product [Ostreobium quekettii]|uniref:Plus3 domain-containing protein n=1 Tax=Ostreobium quekettii TaxID=121088 RepID=A0A8S1JDS3_9CHLO|nr:unnamed protein product [Ostreobium quekettii]